MRHGKKFRKLGRDRRHRQALLKNLATALMKHERIVTTLAKAKELKRVGDRMITHAKRGTPQSRKELDRWMKEKYVVPKVLGPLAKRYEGREGGYTRVLRIPNRKGDQAEMAVIELVENGLPPLPHPKTIEEYNRLQTQMTARSVINGVEQINVPPQGTPV